MDKERQEEEIRKKRIKATRDAFELMANAAKAYGREGFVAYKAFAIAQTTIDTYTSAIAAYKSVAGIPYVGPMLAAAAAGAAIAFGAAQIANIASQNYRERGGPVTAGQPYIVGERRPELFVPQTDGYIMPFVPKSFSGGSRTASGTGGAVTNSNKVGVNNFFDMAMLLDHIRRQSGSEEWIVDVMRRNAHRLT